MRKQGWHYTSWKNWETIRTEGMFPYKIERQTEIAEMFPEGVMGIWVWENPLDPLSELGSIIYQLAYKCETKIVKLMVEYDTNDFLKKDGHPIRLRHSGWIENWKYHPDEPPARIVMKPIPVNEIAFARAFDLMDVVK